MTTTESTSAQSLPMEARFYGIDSRKVTLKEYGYGAKNALQWALVMPIAIVVKAGRIWISGSTDDVPVDSLEPFLTTGEAFPEEIWARMHPLVAEMEGLGFQVAAYHLIEDPAHLTTTYFVTIQGRGDVVGRVHCRVWRQTHPAKVRLFCEFLTRLRGGGYVWSTSAAADMSWPKECVMVRKVRARAAELLALHEKAVAGQRDTVVPVRSVNDVMMVINDHHSLVTEFHVKRGVFGEMHPTELERVRKAHAVPPPPPPPTMGGETGPAPVLAQPMNSRHELVLEEIEKLQNAKAGWRRTAMLLLISLVVFVVAGRGGWAKQDFLYLIPILFFHELGHYLTMRVFKYRNVRMFFIPLFGAAVTGRHYNVPGWKKAVVALMGPVPGVVVGVGLGIAGMVMGQTTLLHVAVLLLIINGANLLPVLPLDGGHVFQTVLFSRHYGLDLAFRIVALLSLVGIAALLGGTSMFYVAIFLGAGIPLAYRLAKISYELRQEGVGGVGATSADDQTVPREVAVRIIDKLSASWKRPVANKMLAQQTLLVYESLNARPPGVAASVLLMLTQGGAVLMAAICAIVFIWSEQGVFKNWRGMMQQAVRQPQHQVPANPVTDWRGPQYVFGGEKEKTVVATFATDTAAIEKMSELTRTLPANTAVRRFGETLFVRFPESATADANTVFDTISSDPKSVFMQTAAQGTGARVMAIANGAAGTAEVKQELDEYLRTASAAPHEIPPWEATRWVTAEEYARYRLARATLVRLRTEGIGLYDDPAYAALSQQWTDAMRRSDTEAAKKVAEQRKGMMTKLRRAKVEHMKALPETEVDRPMLEAFLASPDFDKGGFYKVPAVVVERLGVIPEKELGTPEAAECAKWGSSSTTGLFVTVYATFPSGEHGIPAMCRWLEEKKCVHLLYDMHGSPTDLGDLDD